MHRSWSLLTSFLRLLVIVASLAAVFAGSPGRATAQAPGSCDELQVVFLVDESGSMSQTIDGVPPSDPDGLRWQGPETAVELLGSLRYHAYRDATIRVAVVHYGDRPTLGMPWTAITPQNSTEFRQLLDRLRGYFEPQDTLGNTNPLSAFQNASSLFDMLPAQVAGCPRRVVIALTDGQPWLPTKGFSWPAHLEELATYTQRYMASPDHQIYVIGLDEKNTYWQRNKTYWDAVTGDPAYALRVTSDAELGQKLWEIFADETKAHLKPTGGRTFEECVTGGEVIVRPFVQQVRMTYFKPDVATHLSVVDEQGRPVEPSRRDMQVTLEGLDERIETLTVQLPMPGIWDITNQTNGSDAPLICTVSFIAEGTVATPEDGAVLPQFTEQPLKVSIVDSNGHPLPDYHDQKYLPKVTVSIVPPTLITETVTMTPVAAHEFEGRFLPIRSGPHTVSVRATSVDPAGQEFEIFNKALATYTVTPISYRLLALPDSQIGQHDSLTLRFGLEDDMGNPVNAPVGPSLAVTLTTPTKSELLAPAQTADGNWEVKLTLDEAGSQTVTYETIAQTPTGPLAVASDEVRFDVYPTTRVFARLIEPVDSYVATDMFLRPTGLPLKIQLEDEAGNALSPGQVGAVNPMNLFDAQVTDEQGADRSSELALGNTGKPGLFEARGVTLGPGQYNLTIKPGSELAREYIWAEEEWQATVTGRINMLFLVPLGIALAVILLIVAIVLRSLAVRRHPLSGYLEVYENVFEPQLAEEGEPRSYRRPIFREQLPKRNRVMYGARNWRGARNAMPAKWLRVTCPTQADSDAKRAHVTVKLRDNSTLETTVGPDSAPFPISMGYLLEKGPRAILAGYDGLDGVDGGGAAYEREN